MLKKKGKKFSKKLIKLKKKVKMEKIKKILKNRHNFCRKNVYKTPF